MMKKILLPAALLALCLCYVFLYTPRAQPIQKIDRKVASGNTRSKLAKVAKIPLSPALQTPLDEGEKIAIESLMKLQAEAEAISSSRQLISHLNRLQLKPEVAKDSNPATGTLEILRTSDTLPGTRYFHAQLFSEVGQNSVLQHVSFEIRPGPDSMQTALQLIRSAYGNLGTPTFQSDNYVVWHTQSHRLVSAKRLDEDDIKNNYFNAHSPDDIGTIWVVNELEPESEG